MNKPSIHSKIIAVKDQKVMTGYWHPTAQYSTTSLRGIQPEAMDKGCTVLHQSHQNTGAGQGASPRTETSELLK